MLKTERYLLVPKSMLETAPQGFQQYVNLYFEPLTISGEEYFGAFLEYSTFEMSKKDGKGVAPIHPLSTEPFHCKSMTLNEFIDQAVMDGQIKRMSNSWENLQPSLLGLASLECETVG